MKDKYKHLLNFTANIISLAVEAAMFGWVWYMLYIPMLDKANTFFNRGDWAVIGVYALILFLLTHLYGGFKIGYLRLMDVLYSQILSLICANVVAYIQVVLISREYLSSVPILKMTISTNTNLRFLQKKKMDCIENSAKRITKKTIPYQK